MQGLDEWIEELYVGDDDSSEHRSDWNGMQMKLHRISLNIRVFIAEHNEGDKEKEKMEKLEIENLALREEVKRARA